MAEQLRVLLLLSRLLFGGVGNRNRVKARLLNVLETTMTFHPAPHTWLDHIGHHSSRPNGVCKEVSARRWLHGSACTEVSAKRCLRGGAYDYYYYYPYGFFYYT